ncbi:Signal transduction histidine kinase [Nannocystis exedens]|uniref:histidine kinase n=1 Tax=Nannocystis exedens TaxID=54 RepID=A0A1I1UCZ8_9BACT|nr:Sensor protein ZraS [Nannocystis exedens]SFD68495.1 Signal transduction histidine kinase [Nannocystis exedens]
MTVRPRLAYSRLRALALAPTGDEPLVPAAPPSPPSPRRAWFGALLGFGAGLFDFLLLRLAGVDVSLVVVGFFAVTFAGFGYAIALLLDARDRLKASAAALEASHRRAAHSEKLAAIGRLAAGVAHEVRNPLGVIRSSAALVLEDMTEGTDNHQAARFIIEEVDRLNAVVTALLDYARPLAPRREPVDLAGLVTAVEPLVRDALRPKRGRLDAAEGDGPALRGDPDLLAQLVYGLALNAAQAIGDGGRIELRVRRRGEAVELLVRDDGPGVAPEHAARLFEPFFTTKKTGTGLGLATAARIAEAHGGALELVPGAGLGPEGRGACFCVRLPEAA